MTSAANPNPVPPPRVIAWELTRRCDLACVHCRADAERSAPAGELSTEECFKVIDGVAATVNPILILTGGDPMTRDDLYDIVKYACAAGLSTAVATCGTRLDAHAAERLRESGARTVSISIDGATPAAHDAFRGMPGAFDAAIAAARVVREAGLALQINTTVTRLNRERLGDILALAVRLGAAVYNPFLLVPTGRAKALSDQALSAGEYEDVLEWLASQSTRDDIALRVTCAPHYQRVLVQKGLAPATNRPQGCLGGKSFAFISHTGKAQVCGFLDIECGDLRETGFDFASVWANAEVFRRVRHTSAYKGRCGGCAFRVLCGGCRARAYETTGDYLAEEPLCAYHDERSQRTNP